ncbi:ABC transporter permease [Galenea microaerophila]
MKIKEIILWWQRMAIMVLKELKQLSRDPLLLIIIAYFFTAEIYLAGKGAKITLNNAALMISDHDHSEISRELIYAFQPPYVIYKGALEDDHQTETVLNNSRALAILDIPNQFQQNLLQGKQVALQLQLDASNMSLASLMSGYSAELIGQFAQNYSLQRLGLNAQQMANVPFVQDRHRVRYNPNQEDSWFMSISELLTVTTMITMILTAAAAVREKERGTIEQLMVSPLTPMQILLPKVIAMGGVILLAITLSLYGIIQPLFHVPLQNVGLFYLVSTLYVFAISGFGLFIASISRNLGQVAMLALLFILPISLLSGAWTPPEAMPSVLRYAMFLSPLSYFTEMSYAVLLKGAGLKTIADSMIGLMLLGGVIFALGLRQFRRQLS